MEQMVWAAGWFCLGVNLICVMVNGRNVFIIRKRRQMMDRAMDDITGILVDMRKDLERKQEGEEAQVSTIIH